MIEKDFLLFCLRTLRENFTGRVFIVGGFVREKLLGKETFDFDFVVENNSLEITQKIAKITKGVFVLLDQERQTGRIAWNKNFSPCEMDFDITTIVGKNIEEDLQSRDLTINALAIELKDDWEKFFDNNYQLKESDIVDFSNGYKDFQNKTLKTFKESNLTDDPLRMLRVFRFSSKLNFEINSITLDQVIKNSHLIIKPAKERVLKELFSIFESTKTHEIIKVMSKTKLIDLLFEDLGNIDETKLERIYSNLKYFEDLNINLSEIDSYLDTCLTLNHKRKTLVKMIVFFYYFGKDSDIKEFMSKVTSFIKKTPYSTNEQRFILNNLNFIFNNNLYFDITDRKALYFFFKERNSETISSLLLTSILNENLNNSKEKQLLDIYITDKILSSQPKIINGNDLIKELNIKSGKQIGELIEKINIAQAKGIVNSYNEAVLFAKNTLEIL
jgi:poly(A) polymerase